MKNKIQKILKLVEQKHHVRILYACESGSRAWGFASKDSDWDVRFIYVRPLEKYLTVFENDNFTIDINNSKIAKDFKKFNIDIVGWDLRKALFQLSKHNMNLISWLVGSHSETTYLETQESKVLQQMAKELFCPKTAYDSMLGIAHQTFSKYVRDVECPLAKKYMYLVRPILCCLWLEYYATVPPVRIEDIYNDHIIQPELKRNEVLNDVLSLVEKKKSGIEADTCVYDNIEEFYLDKKSYYTSISQGLPPFVRSDEELEDLKSDIDSHFINFLM